MTVSQSPNLQHVFVIFIFFLPNLAFNIYWYHAAEEQETMAAFDFRDP